MKRRETVIGGLVTLAFGVVRPVIATGADPDLSHVHGPGCFLTKSEAIPFFNVATESRVYMTGNEPMIPKSGDPEFDLALAQGLARISALLDVAPGFAYYDDSTDGKNAYATPVVRLNGKDGTVLFGQGLLKQLLNSPESPDACIAAVCAHEFGHVLQNKHDLMGKLMEGQATVKRVELQADFFSGYFAGVRKLERPSFPAAVFAVTQFSFGDNMVNDPGHHGTKEERAQAIVAGFKVGHSGKKEISQLISAANDYAMQT
jgi:hypothetical protein